MKVAFLIPKLIYCGPINVVLGIINNIRMLDHDVECTIICLDGYFDNFLLNKIVEENLASVIFFDRKMNANEALDLFSKFDVVHSHGFYPDKILSKLDIHSKKISTAHCMFYRDYPKEYGLFKGYLGSFMHLIYYKFGNFDHIVGCSDSVSNYIASKIKNKNIISINNGVDQRVYKPLSIQEKILKRQDLGLNRYKRFFIFSGRIIRRKCVPELIRYFCKNSKSSDLLIILGDGEELNRCKIEALDSDNIVFLGHVDNPHIYYQISDFIISNSSAEGYPMSILEGISCGCVGILSNIEPHVEFIKKNPDCAILLDDFIFEKDFSTLSLESYYSLSARYMTSLYLQIYR